MIAPKISGEFMTEVCEGDWEYITNGLEKSCNPWWYGFYNHKYYCMSVGLVPKKLRRESKSSCKN